MGFWLDIWCFVGALLLVASGDFIRLATGGFYNKGKANIETWGSQSVSLHRGRVIIEILMLSCALLTLIFYFFCGLCVELAFVLGCVL